MILLSLFVLDMAGKTNGLEIELSFIQNSLSL